MAQLNKTTYKTIANSFASCAAQLATSAVTLRTAVTTVTDITTIAYTNSLGAVDANAAIDVTLSLLPALNSAYSVMSASSSSTSGLLPAVKAVNDYVIKNATDAEKAAADLANQDVLTYYVQNGMSWDSADYYDDTHYWAVLSKQAGYSVSGWTLLGGNLI